MTNTTPMNQTEPQEILPDSLTCEQLYSMEKAGERPTILDVREQDEWDAGHIEWATHLPLGKVETDIEHVIADKSEPIIACCASGGRSAQAQEILIAKGYTNVKNLVGGYTGYCGVADNPEMMEQEEEA